MISGVWMVSRELGKKLPCLLDLFCKKQELESCGYGELKDQKVIPKLWGKIHWSGLGKLKSFPEGWRKCHLWIGVKPCFCGRKCSHKKSLGPILDLQGAAVWGAGPVWYTARWRAAPIVEWEIIHLNLLAYGLPEQPEDAPLWPQYLPQAPPPCMFSEEPRPMAVMSLGSGHLWAKPTGTSQAE